MTKDEALKLALEALEASAPWVELTNEAITNDKAISDIKEALAHDELCSSQKPVAWVREHELPLAPGDAFSWVETFVHKTPLYTTPPKAEQEQHQCKGIPRKGCNYLTACGHVCNKCGEIHHAHMLAYVFDTPPKREWVGLTDEQWQIFADTLECFITRQQKDIIEAKLKEKNT